MRKIEILIVLMALMAICLAGMANAATFTAPTSGSVIRGDSPLFNVTTTMNNVTRCNITGSSALTSGVMGVTLVNYSVSANYANGTNTTLVEIDASDWTFSGNCNNGTTTETITAITGVIIDNTEPNCSITSTLTSNNEYLPTQVWSVTGFNATAAYLQFGADARLTMNESSAGDVFSYQGTILQTVYKTVSFITSDGANETTCQLTDIIVDDGSTAEAYTKSMATTGQKMAEAQQTTTGTPISKYAVVLIAIAGIYYVKYMRKR